MKSLRRWVRRAVYYGGVSWVCYAATVGDARWASSLLPFLLFLLLSLSALVMLALLFAPDSAIAEIRDGSDKQLPIGIVAGYHLALALAVAADGRYGAAMMAAMLIVTNVLSRAIWEARGEELTSSAPATGVEG